MKRYTLLYYIAALFSLTTISCSDENSLGEDYVPSLVGLKVSSTNLFFEPSASSQSIIVKSNLDYTVTSSATWCTATQSTDGTKIIISVDNNTTLSQREALVTLNAEDSKLSKIVNVTQSEVFLDVSSTYLNFSSSASSQSVTVTSNWDYTVTSSASWCTATTSSDRKTLIINVAANNSGEIRVATVNMKNEHTGLTAQISINQSGPITKKMTLTGNGKTVSFSMKLVEPGTFQMGSTSGDSNETPVHQVTITQFYYIGETEVTQALWYAVMGQSPTLEGSQKYYPESWSTSYGLGDDYPAYFISYEDVTLFLDKLNSLVASQLPSGMNFRFPTEAEWEFAAKGGNKSKGYTYSGSNSVDDVAWFADNSGGSSHQVKMKAANELGLYDMSGNVWEWCYDWYGSYSSNDQIDPTGPNTSHYTTRVHRGGGFENLYAKGVRPSYRGFNSPDYGAKTYGFRLALSFISF